VCMSPGNETFPPSKAVNQVDGQILNLLQRAFPLQPAPFAALGEQLGLAEEVLLRRVQELKDGGLIRQIGPIFDSQQLGYRSTLATFHVPPERLDDVARRISGHAGVSHNYSRSHHYNLWFTLTLPGEQDLGEEVRRLAQETKVDDYLNLPAIRTFKIGVHFSFSEQANSTRKANSPLAAGQPALLSPFERQVVRATQGDLPLVQRPFQPAARQLGTTEERLLETMRALEQRGVLRRFGAVLHHRRAGFTANGMACWVIPVERIEAAGAAAADFREVSHCYQRPAYPPHWPYTLFTMIHGRERAEVEACAARVRAAIEPAEHTILYSQKQYKKQRVRYFSEERQSCTP